MTSFDNVLNADGALIIGAGLAGLVCALKLAPRPVTVLSPKPLGFGASSAWAQGGVAAAVGKGDSSHAHAIDTEMAGAGIVDHGIAESVTAEAAARIEDLARWGTPFDRDDFGNYQLGREAAHSTNRIVKVEGDRAGWAIMQALIAQVRRTPSIRVVEGITAVDLAQADGRIIGVYARKLGDRYAEPIFIRARATVLAAGGLGGLYAVTTNPSGVRGHAMGMAARAGAVIADAEFVQFHPTAIDSGEDPAPLATEALRGEGAHLINRLGQRFMPDLHPDAELAPRDIVARAIYAQTLAGLRPMLDTRAALGARILRDFPAVAEACARAGIDPVSAAIPVAAAAHYHMGGIATDIAGRTSLGNLWACGEAASTGLHGANRLASNGLLEALVFARRCAVDIAAKLPQPNDCPPIAMPALAPAGVAPAPERVADLRRAMTECAGVIRTGAGLRAGLRRIAMVEAAEADSPALLNMTATATLITGAALMREESRGAHFRSDFPHTLAQGQRSRLTLDQALALRPAPEPEMT